ncbi:MAG TPA: Zn-ribbon domain-containing OB-fold protein [Dehalococcoidia bacterium]|nr:Zn-ribbon domain-containing OB-fold protein [Dehalococcoidia bacterium]
MVYQKPLPKPNADDRFFWEGCKEHKLLFQKCLDCGLVRWPPSIICPNCHSNATEVIEVAGRGKIYTYAVYHQAYHPGFEKDLPYVTAVIELDGGPHFLSNLIDCEPDEVKCDMPVEIVWEDITKEFSLPKFKLVR